jgi:hypothetical protein
MSAVEFFDQAGILLLRYEPRGDASWIHELFERDKTLHIKKTFHFSRKHVVAEQAVEPEDEWSLDNQYSVSFQVAVLDGEYFRFDREILNIEVDLLIHKDVILTYKLFTAEQGISIFRVIAELKPDRIVVGGTQPDAIPESGFNDLVQKFPSGFELKRYALARVSSVVREYTETSVDGEKLFRRYVDKRPSKKAKNFRQAFKEGELQKYRFLHSRLRGMLDDEEAYFESAWQAEILQILLLLNPKYIKALRQAPVKVKDTRNVTRYIDILLIDAAGHIDIVELKKPFGQCIVSKALYRDNHIPLRELSGTVMQIEKYLFYLNKWGQEGEKYLTKKYKADLPPGFLVRITNPGGIVIMGRDSNLTDAQRQDFEVVKRKYKNIIDIITYDDLLRRLDFIVKQLESDA